MSIIALFSPILLISSSPFFTCLENFMQNMKLTTSNVQELSLYISNQLVSHVKCMHNVKLTHMSKLLIEK